MNRFRVLRRAALLACAGVLAACAARPLGAPTNELPAPRTADLVHTPAYLEPQTRTPPAAAEAAAVAVPVERPLAPIAPPPPAAEQPLAPLPPPASRAAAAEPALAGEAAAQTAAAGRWAVQVGVFAIASNAERIRAQVQSRLARSDLAPELRDVRIERIGDRWHVLVGGQPDRASALALAAQLRRLLGHDVVVLRR